MRAYVRHLRANGYCGAAAAPWFAQHGLDWKDFVKNGIELDTLRAIDDLAARKVVAAAEAEYGRG